MIVDRLTLMWIGLGVQGVIWPVLYVLAITLDRWRWRRAQGRGERVGHFNEVILVLATLSVLAWVGAFLVRWVQEPADG
jgi:hypothetical protein